MTRGMHAIWISVVVVIMATSMHASSSTEHFSEELYLRPLADGNLLSHFQFTTQAQVEDDHYELFPKSIGQLIRHLGVEEMHITFSRGRWWSETWGHPVIAAPPGVELYAYFGDACMDGSGIACMNETAVDQQWKKLTYTLAGLFCASMEQMDVKTTTSPAYSFRPSKFAKMTSSASQNDGGREEEGEEFDSSMLRYSLLPRETVCTENLTPYIKLLPCRSKIGLASLLTPRNLYNNVDFHSMGIHIRSICTGTKECIPALQLIQTLTVVHHLSFSDWSFQKLFGSKSVQSCPLSTESKVYVDMPSNFEFNVQPKAAGTEGSLEVYDLKTMDSLALSGKFPASKAVQSVDSVPTVTASRFLTGYGEEFGGIAMNIINTGDEDVQILYHEFVPWYLRLFFHTLRFKLNGKPVHYHEIFDSYHFLPGEDHSSPAVIEFSMVIPAHSKLSSSVDFEKAFLHWTEYPPDAHRGLDAASSVLTVLRFPNASQTFTGLDWSPVTGQKGGTPSYQVYTPTLLISMPTPDFSMPYNVITLTGTVFALFFTTVYNLLIRRMKNMDKEGDDYVSNRPAARLFRRVKAYLNA